MAIRKEVNMKLSQFDNSSLQDIYRDLKPDNNVICDFTDEQISAIVFGGIADNQENCDVAVVFGNSDMILERTKKAIEMYKQGRVKQLLFTGGSNGITAKEGDRLSEAEKMANIAYQSGIPKNKIIIEGNSNNSFENVSYSVKLLQERMDINEIKNIMLITSDFHLKRCYSIFLKYLPNMRYTLVGVKNGYSDEENWINSELSWGSGRSIVMFEANALINYAKQSKIEDLEIENYPINRK